MVVDLARPKPLAMWRELLRNNAPRHARLHVAVGPRGLVLRLDSSSGGNLIISEVGQGTTARELGIYAPQGRDQGYVAWGRSRPGGSSTTSLRDILGSRAPPYLWLPGDDNDMILEAAQRGEEWNDFRVRFVADPFISAGNEVVHYDSVQKIIEVRIAPYQTQARQVVAAINRAYSAGALPFWARLDPLDDRQGGLGLVPVTPAGQWAGVTAWGSGRELDQSSGLQIRNGQEVYTIDLSAAETVEDLLNLLNRQEYGLYATIDDTGKRLVVRTRRSGANFAIGENGGETATQLGIRSFSLDTRLSELQFGRGVTDYAGRGNFAAATLRSTGPDNDLTIRARTAGAQWNDFTVRFVDSAGPPGSESISYDPAARLIEVRIVPGSTRARDVIRLFDTTPEIRDYFVAELAGGEGATEGLGLVEPGEAVTSGGFAPGCEFRIVRADGVMFEIDITGCQTIRDVLDRINNHPQNLASGTPVVARLARFGNGIELVDGSGGPGTLTVLASTGQLAAIELGLIPPGTERAEATAANGQQILTGREVAPLKAKGLFTALLRLRQALLEDNLPEIRTLCRTAGRIFPAA